MTTLFVLHVRKLYSIIRRYVKRSYIFIRSLLRRIDREIEVMFTWKTIMLLTSVLTIAFHYYNVSLHACKREKEVVEYKPRKLTKSETRRLPVIHHPRPVLEDTRIKVEATDNYQDMKEEEKENFAEKRLISIPKKIYDFVFNLITRNYIKDARSFISKIVSDIKEHGFFSTMEFMLLRNGIKLLIKVKKLFCKRSDEFEEKKGLLENLGIRFVVTVVGKHKPVEKEPSNIILKGISRLGSLTYNVVSDISTTIKGELSELCNLINTGVSGIGNLISKGVNKLNSCFSQEQEVNKSNTNNLIDLVGTEGESSNMIQKGVSRLFGLINKGISAFKGWYAGSTEIEEVNSDDSIDSSLQEEFSNFEGGSQIIQDELIGFRNISQQGLYRLQNTRSFIRGPFSNYPVLLNEQEESLDINSISTSHSSSESNFVSCEDNNFEDVCRNQCLQEELCEDESDLYYDAM